MLTVSVDITDLTTCITAMDAIDPGDCMSGISKNVNDEEKTIVVTHDDITVTTFQNNHWIRVNHMMRDGKNGKVQHHNYRN